MTDKERITELERRVRLLERSTLLALKPIIETKKKVDADPWLYNADPALLDALAAGNDVLTTPI